MPSFPWSSAALSVLCRRALAAALCLGAVGAQADVRLTFDTDAQGVTAADGGDLSHDAAGFLVMRDVSDADMRALLPAAVLAGASGYLGGRLSFDAISLDGDSADWSPFGEVTLTGGGLSLTVDIAAPGQPGTSWSTYGVDLTTAVWGTSLPTVLADLQGVAIKLEFHAGVTEVAGLDNVSITAVPEPGALLLLLAGGPVLAWATRQRR